MRRTLLTLCLIVSLGPSPALADGPFVVPTLSKAQALAEPDGRLVIIYLYNERNADCAFMDREAWTHPEVQTWMAGNAVAAKVDLFSMHGAALKNQYGVDGAPAVLAFEGDRLLRVQNGALSGVALLSWLQGTREGDGLAMRAIPSRAPAPAADVDVASELQDALRLSEPVAAARALVELWDLTARGAQQEERRMPTAEAMRPFVQNSFQAAERVQRARANAWGRYSRDARLGDLVDWLTLNAVLDESQASVRWAREQSDGDCAGTVGAALGHPQDPLLPLLFRQRDFEVIGRCLREPTSIIDARHATYRATRITITGSQRQEDLDEHRTLLGALAAGLLVSRRNREAKRASQHILDLDPKAGPAIVRVALDAGEPRRWHRSMIDIADRNNLELAIELATALKSR